MAVSFDASVSGMQAATARLDVAANNVANVNTLGFAQSTASQVEVTPQGTRLANLVRTPNNPAAPSNTDLVKETKEQEINKDAYQADLKVIKTQDRMTGTLLDMFA